MTQLSDSGAIDQSASTVVAGRVALPDRAVTREAAQARMLRASRAMVTAEGQGRMWLNAANRRRHAQKAFLQAGGTWEEVHEIYAQAEAEKQ